MNPKQYSPDIKFILKKELILKLCEEAISLFSKESSLLKLRQPLKIFGNINGQYGDLMKFFEHFGTPHDNSNDGGDIERIDYLFLGDYVDRGK